MPPGQSPVERPEDAAVTRERPLDPKRTAC